MVRIMVRIMVDNLDFYLAKFVLPLNMGGRVFCWGVLGFFRGHQP